MKLRGRITQVMFPGYSWCSRCLTTWNIVEGHSVSYIGVSEEQRKRWWLDQGLEPPPRYKDHPSSGLFAICEECWQALTPEERLPYYYELFWGYKHSNMGDVYRDRTQQDLDLMWEEIQTKILQELD